MVRGAVAGVWFGQYGNVIDVIYPLIVIGMTSPDDCASAIVGNAAKA